jgi:hypothetical protein
MSSRITIAALLATGLLMADVGAASAASALSVTGDAASAQYGQQSVTPPPLATPPTPANLAPSSVPSTAPAGVAPADTGGVPAQSPNEGSGNVAAAHASPNATAEVPRQHSAAEADKLPFTGYAAIAVLFIGLALLAGGLLLRGATRRRTA